MKNVSHLARDENKSLFDTRRAFNQRAHDFQSWFRAQVSPSPDEIWQEFNAQLAAAFESQREGVWMCAVHPQQRSALAQMFCEVAHAKMQLDPTIDPLLDPIESRLWEAALRSSPRAVVSWESAVLERNGEIGFGFVSVKHRLADSYRRMARTDGAAMRLYIETFIGRNAVAPSRFGTNQHQSLPSLLERGAALTSGSSPEEVQARYSLCLLLWNRGWRVPWVERSLQLARSR